MSFFKWISGGTFASNVEDGNKLFGQKQYGDAKMAFGRALKKSKEASPAAIKEIEEKIDHCSYELGLARIDTAREFFKAGDVERAMEYLDDVLLICDTPEMEAKVESGKAEFVQLEAKAMAEEHIEMSEDELLAVISGAWTAAQTQEFSDYPESFYQGLIQGHDGEHAKAAELIQGVIEQSSHQDTVFIYLELGRQQLLSDDVPAAQQSLETFVEKCDQPSDAKDELVVAYNLLANIYIKEDRFELAEETLMTAFKTDTENHVPLLNLGIFLRDRGELERSKRSLENAMDTMGAMHPDMRVFRELGHTLLAMDNKKEAMEYYKAVVEHCCQRGVHEQYDPEAALPLAVLYEENGQIQEASDIFRHLAQGYDKKNYFEYNYQSARLLSALKVDDDLIQQYVVSAEELADSGEQVERISALKASI